MARTPYLVQTGMGVDIHGADDTTAAERAVREAIGHNSLLFLRQVGLSSADQIKVDVTIACPHPDRIDVARVASVLPVGDVSVHAETGGMLFEPDANGDPLLIALAAVLVSVDA